jgi:transposase InsO family protein
VPASVGKGSGGCQGSDLWTVTGVFSGAGEPPRSWRRRGWDLARIHEVLLSVGRTGVCWDNAMAESFFATFKNELIYRHPWPTKARTKTAVITWIEGRYNRRRRHSAIGMLTPVQFETAARHTAAQAA